MLRRGLSLWGHACGARTWFWLCDHVDQHASDFDVRRIILGLAMMPALAQEAWSGIEEGLGIAIMFGVFLHP